MEAKGKMKDEDWEVKEILEALLIDPELNPLILEYICLSVNIGILPLALVIWGVALYKRKVS